MDLSSTAFWAGLGSIIIANILLSGDNAVVIALAARSLPAHQQKKAILFGSGAAIVLRIVLTLVAAAMLRLPFLKIIGGLLLLYIGVDLLGGDDEGEGELGKENGNLGSAVRTILVADLVMSLDNVLAVAAGVGLGHQHPAHRFRQYLAAGDHAAFSHHHHLGRCTVGLSGR